jgi:glycosyltransferase involved in cell wall biosynthesis
VRVVWVVEGGIQASGFRETVPLLLDLVRVMAGRVELTVVAIEQFPRPGTFRVHGVEVRDLALRTRRVRRLFAPVGLRDLRPDVVHAFGLGLTSHVGACIAGRRPLVASLWGGEHVWLPAIGYGGAGSAWRRAALHAVVRRATVVTAPSAFALEGITSRRADVVLQPMFGDLGASTTSAPARGGAHLLTVGSVRPVKGPDVMLAALDRVRRTIPASLTWMGGDDGFKASEAEFTGIQPPTVLADAFRRATIYVQSSHHESAGIAVTEAAGFGCPIVGTAVGFVAEMAPNAAVAVRPGDAAALAGAIVALLQDASRREALGAAARAWRAGRDAKWTAARLLALYESVA